MASITGNGFHEMEWFSLKCMASNKRNGFEWGTCLPLKGTVSTKWNEYYYRPMVSTKNNGFH